MRGHNPNSEATSSASRVGQESSRHLQWWGVPVGGLIGVFYVKVAGFTLTLLDAPQPVGTPGYYDVHPRSMPFSYWSAWVLALVAVALPGIVLFWFMRTRRAALPYLVTVLTICGLEAWAFINFAFDGFAPDM